LRENKSEKVPINIDLDPMTLSLVLDLHFCG